MSIFEFGDFRPFLKRFFHGLPKRGHGEINRIAEHLSVHASYISQVMGGTKCFSPEQAQDLSAYLGLSPLETDYLILLVQIERAGTKQMREYWQAKINHVKAESHNVAKRVIHDRALTEHESSLFHSSWLNSAVRLYTAVGDGKTLDEITTRFQITRQRAAKIVAFLVQMGLCREKDGRFMMGPQRTHLEQGSPFISRFHSNWRVKSIERSEDVASEELMFTAPMSIGRKEFAAVREQLVQMIQSVSKLVSKSEAEDVAWLNLDLLWVPRK